MARSAVHHFEMDVRARSRGEPFEEILNQLGLKIADPRNLQPEIDDRVRASAAWLPSAWARYWVPLAAHA